MTFRKFLNILLAIIIAVASISTADTYARKSSKAKAKTTQTRSKKSSGKKSKKSKSIKKSTSKKSRKSRKKRSTRKKNSSWKKTRPTPAPEQQMIDSLTLSIHSAVLKWIPDNMNPGGLRVNSVKPNNQNRTARVGLNENFTYLPVTHELIRDLQNVIHKNLPDSLKDFSVTLNVGTRPLSYYITKVDKLPEKYRANKPFVVQRDPYINPKKGMEGDIVALWHSHGRYYKPSADAWMWQRPLLFETVEDIYTMGYILPYVVPMLENAGAYVMLPRERDTNRNEVIVDNDTNDGGFIFSQPYYREISGTCKWETGEEDGFIYDLKDFRDTENPFEVGTYRQTTTVRSGEPSVAAWYANIPEDGEYAVYISYKTLPNSTSDARYTVNYSGGAKDFIVNQTMGGSTWIYLGTFPLKAGYSETTPVVSLTNISGKEAGKILTADAVKIGGGMGNIARSRSRKDVYYDPSTPESDNTEINSTDNSRSDEEDDTEEDEEDDEENESDDEENGSIDSEPEENSQNKNSDAEKRGPAPTFRISNYPRFLEGARYWLHWAGFPENIYSPYHGSDDYKDDYTSRALWVNYLAGGSRVLPDRTGLNIPVDVAMALHSDAGKRSDDSFVGTLGIYYTNNGDSYDDGTARINSRMLTDLLMRQITGDIRQSYESNWTRRSMWDKSYVEARIPEVPTALIELLSHQNFADMQYGLDPGFRFTVGRAIYKALARFISERKDRQLIIQPLPVADFSIVRTDKGKYKLSWSPVPDPLEPTAMPSKYIILERSAGTLGFHKIGETRNTSFEVKVNDHDIHSFRIIAANDGGVSFPSETLAFRESDDHTSPVLIINGFTRVSGPGHFNIDGSAGFNSQEDFGVPYIKDISFAGHQREFRRNSGESFGRSDGNFATQIIAGNTFDFVAEHGESIADAGFGFVSSSVAAVEKGSVRLKDYKVIDLILGKQKETIVGNGKSGPKFKTFSPRMQKAIKDYLHHGGDLLVSGQYIVTDLYGTRSSHEDRKFASDVLGIMPVEEIEPEPIRNARIEAVQTSINTGLSTNAKYAYSNTLNEKKYIVENPDRLLPNPDKNAETLMEFSDNGSAAAVVTKSGKGKTIVMTVPFESIKDLRDRDRLMKEILDFFEPR